MLRQNTNARAPCGPGRRRDRSNQQKFRRSAMANSHILVGASASPARPVVRRISPSDLYQSLARGVDDFLAMPSHAVFLCVIYPLLGILMIGAAVGGTILALAFPIASRF